MRKIAEFQKFTDEECERFDKLFIHWKDRMRRDGVEGHVLRTVIEYAEKQGGAQQGVEAAKKILSGSPYISAWVPIEAGSAEEFFNLFKKIDTDDQFLLYAKTGTEDDDVGTDGLQYFAVFDEAKCRQAGMVGARDCRGRYLCHDGTFYAPTMNFYSKDNDDPEVEIS